MRSLIGLVAAAALAAPAVAEEGNKIALDGENTKVEFIGSKPDGKHEGGFKKLTGTASIKASDPATLKIDVVIDTTSLYSDNDKLTAHLKSPDFFGVKANPTAKFASTKVEKGEEGYLITGDLTLCGKTRGITFPATVTATGDKLTLKSQFKIDRRDFGMTYGEGKVDSDVQIKVALEAKK